MQQKGKLYLIPNLLGGDAIDIIPQEVVEAIQQINEYIVENERNARRYLIKLGIKTPIDDLTFHVLDKHKKHIGIDAFLTNAIGGNSIGLISDAGSPAVADPGALVVAAAHRKGLLVQPLVGPSSILLSLMGSGLNGQQFTFHGYLPIEPAARTQKIRFLDKLIEKEGYTHIFIETPYRNNKLLEGLLQHASKHTRLCIATDITLPTEEIITQSIAKWKSQKIDLHKRPTIFLLGK